MDNSEDDFVVIEERKQTWLERVWWFFFGLFFSILFFPMTVMEWWDRKVHGETTYRGAGALGLGLIITIVFWAVVIAALAAFLIL